MNVHYVYVTPFQAQAPLTIAAILKALHGAQAMHCSTSDGSQAFSKVSHALELTWKTDFFSVKGEPLLMILHNCMKELFTGVDEF